MSNGTRNGTVTPPKKKGEVEAELLQHATERRDVLAAAMNDLRARGISQPEQFAHLGADAISGTVRWYDHQNGRVRTGVLVTELRAGGRPGWTPMQQGSRSILDQQRDYAASIVAWLSRHFPEFDRPVWGPHPAAVAEVICLHYRDGKGSLTVARHGPEIRAAVRAWERKWGEAT